jgi:hypothetical protein
MEVSLRTFVASWPWRIKVFVGCLVYIAFIEVVPRMSPSIASWPWSVRAVLVALELIAIFAAYMIFSAVIAKYIVSPFMKWSFDVKFETRSDKAKEKIADSFMSTGTAIQSAVLIGMLVAPFTAFIQALLGGPDPVMFLYEWLGAGRWSY